MGLLEKVLGLDPVENMKVKMKESRAKYRNKFINFENGNYTENEYNDLLYDLQYDDRFENDDDKYYGARAFLMTITSPEVVNTAFADVEQNNLKTFMHHRYLWGLQDFIVNCWTLQDITNPNDVFRVVINNPAFIKRFGMYSKEKYFDKGIYHAYVLKLYDIESANDEESVIYCFDLYDNDDDTVQLIVKYDVMLKNKYPQYRHELLYYESEFEHKGKKYIVHKLNNINVIEKKMTDLGINFNRSLRLKV